MPWWRRLPAWISVVGAFVVVVAIASAAPRNACTAAFPCTATFLAPSVFGVLLAVPVVVYLHRTVAAVLAVVLALVWLVGYPGVERFGWWATTALVAYAVLGVVLALGRAAGPEEGFGPPTAFVVPPTPDAPLPRWRTLWAVAGGLFLAAVGGFWWAARAQKDAVALDPDADATGWIILPILAVGLALGLAARAFDRVRAVRRLFHEPQPVRHLDVYEFETLVKVLGRAATVRLRAVRLRGDFPDARRSAQVYGDPAPGGWCAVAVAGRIRVPLGPARLVPSVVDDNHTAVELPDVPDELLTGEDRAPAAAAVRNHRSSAIGHWAFMAGAGLWPASWLILLGPAPWPIVLAAAAVMVALGLEFAWRWFGRQHVAWNDAGIVTLTGARQTSLRWDEVNRIDRHQHLIALLTDRGRFTVSAGRRPSGGRRSADQLWAALVNTHRRARATSSSTVELPAGFPVRRHPALPAVWVVDTAVLTAIVLWVAGHRP